MTDLDDLEAIRALDSLDVLPVVESFPEQVHEAWAAGGKVGALPQGDGVDSVVILGMGGSAAAGDIAQAIVEPRLPVPFRVIRSFGPLPEWIGRNTLVVGLSYSGNTAETLASFEEAHARGARLVALCSGGLLAKRAVAYGVAHIAVRAGLQPRAALPYLVMPLLRILCRIGLVPDLGDDVDETIEVLSGVRDRCLSKISEDDNPAKALARRITGRVPVIYGGSGVGGAVARRFKCDVNEYGKTPAFFNELPELDHNEIEGWSLGTDPFALVMLFTPSDDELIRTRWALTRRLINASPEVITEIEGEGGPRLAQALSLVLMLQLVAIYVGIARGIDPGPTQVLDRLKAELSANGEEGAQG